MMRTDVAVEEARAGTLISARTSHPPKEQLSPILVIFQKSKTLSSLFSRPIAPTILSSREAWPSNARVFATRHSLPM